jgi:hypothetical protein
MLCLLKSRLFHEAFDTLSCSVGHDGDAPIRHLSYCLPVGLLVLVVCVRELSFTGSGIKTTTKYEHTYP